MNETPQSIIAFWRKAGPEKWFAKDAAFDAEIRDRFLGAYEQAAAGSLSDWQDTPEGALALILLLDQFPRNMFRNDPRAFAADPLAREVAVRAIERGFDKQADPPFRPFFYLPLMHSEALVDQERSLDLFRSLGDPKSLKYAQIHADIVRRYGRFPHRNQALGRPTSAEEQAFLDSGGFAG